MATTDAWLLDFGYQIPGALGIREVIQLIDANDTIKVPQCHPACQSIKLWQEHMLPVVDLACLTTTRRMGGDLLAVVAYQSRNEATTELGALLLHAPPQRILVDDRDAIEAPSTLAAWSPIMLACFAREQKAVPILDLHAIFAESHIPGQRQQLQH